MKTLRHTFIAGLAFVASGITLLSCQKEFNAKSYAPPKPLQTFGGYSSSKDIEASSLVAYWPFTSSFTDSVSNLAGTVSGNVTAGAGISGKGFQGADNSYVVFSNPGNVIPKMQSYTIAFWMKTTNINGLARGIFSLNNPTDFWGSLDIYLDNPPADDKNADTLTFRVHMTNASGVTYAGQFLQAKVANAISKWVHMTITYDGATSKFNIYQDDKAITIGGVAGQKGFVLSPVIPGDDPVKNPGVVYGPLKFPNPTAMVIGTWQFQTNPSLTSSAGAQSWAGSYTGALDDFRIYSKALTIDEVKALYNLELAGR